MSLSHSASAQVEVGRGPMTLAQAAELQAQQSDKTREILLSYIYPARYTFLWPCGDHPEGQFDAFDFSVKGLKPPRRNGRDLGCALTDAGVVPLGMRTYADITNLVFTTTDGLVLAIEARMDGTEITEVVSVRGFEEGIVVLRERKPEYPAFSWANKTEERPVSARESLKVFDALLGDEEMDLSIVGIGPAPGETLPDDEPGCAETGRCQVLACGPSPQVAPHLAEVMIPTDTKMDLVCPNLESWQTRRHLATAPDEDLIRRALILATQAALPEDDIRDAGMRVISVHTLSGTRMVAFAELAPGLMTTPVVAQEVEEVKNISCDGNARAQICDVTVVVEHVSRAANMPRNMPQTVLVETIGFPTRTFEKDLRLPFKRENARWELQAADSVGIVLFDMKDARETKSPVEHMLDGMRQLR
ncbi:MAG: hypothetical protein AAFX45_07410 [Pseudomonadota bacterium]